MSHVACAPIRGILDLVIQRFTVSYVGVRAAMMQFFDQPASAGKLGSECHGRDGSTFENLLPLAFIRIAHKFRQVAATLSHGKVWAFDVRAESAAEWLRATSIALERHECDENL